MSGKGITNKIGNYRYADGAKAEKKFDGGRTFIVLIAGAYDVGIIGSEDNGIVILDHDHGAVVLDQHYRTSSGYDGPSGSQLAEFRRILAMDWKEFTSFIQANPRYGQGSVPDIRMDQPIGIAPIVDRKIFPTSSPLRNDASPYLAPLTRRREMIDFLAGHSVHRIDRFDPWTLSWNIKVGGFDYSGKQEGFRPDASFDEAWNDYLQKNDDWLFWEVASDATSVYTGGDYTMYEGSPAKTFEFQKVGRSGGHLVLTRAFGHKLGWEDHATFKVWLDELKDEDLVALYRAVDQIDADLKDPRAEMAYQYALHRQAKEEEWSNETKPAVA